MKFITSNAISIKIGFNGSLMLFNSISRPIRCIDEIDLTIIRLCIIPASYIEIRNSIKDIIDIAEPVLKDRIQSLVNYNILISQDTLQQIELAKEGYANIRTHHRMIKDYIRTNAYRAAIFKHAKHQKVLEIGCGTGILSIFAYHAGASSVLAIEESKIAILAQKMFKANEAPVKLYYGNSLNIDIEEHVDIIIHELLGVDVFDENVLVYIEDAKKRFLKPCGKLIPYHIDVYAIGIESQFTPSLLDRTKLEAYEFTELYGININPYMKVLQEMQDSMEVVSFLDVDPSLYLGNMNSYYFSNFSKHILTKECLLYSINLEKNFNIELERQKEVNLEISTNGRLGSILIYFKAYLDKELAISNSPFTPLTHWRRDIRELPKIIDVTRGEKLKIYAKLHEENGRQKLQLKA